MTQLTSNNTLEDAMTRIYKRRQKESHNNDIQSFCLHWRTYPMLGLQYKAQHLMHQIMNWLKFNLALDKTYIGLIKRGFDFLGYRFSHQGMIGWV